MTLARARRLVILSGLVVIAAVAAGLAVVGGPEAGRRDRRDTARLEHIRQIADALACHARAAAEPPAPLTVEAISGACLPGDRSRIADPSTGAAFAISYTAPGSARVCASFERPDLGEAGTLGWPPFDPATGCVTVSLTNQ